MAETRREGMKQWLLLGYIALNIVLVLFIWMDNLTDKQSNTGFIRSNQGPSAPASGARLTATPETATPVSATPVSATNTGPQETPFAQPETPLAPAAPSRTPAPNRDSGDLGMQRSRPGQAFSGS